MIRTVSLQTARVLKEAGFGQKAELFWAIYKTRGRTPVLYHDTVADAYDVGETFAAPTSDELLEELRKVKYDSMGFPALQIIWALGKWHVHYRNPPTEWSKNGSQEVGIDNELPESLAKMWIWIKKEGILNV